MRVGLGLSGSNRSCVVQNHIVWIQATHQAADGQEARGEPRVNAGGEQEEMEEQAQHGTEAEVEALCWRVGRFVRDGLGDRW